MNLPKNIANEDHTVAKKSGVRPDFFVVMFTKKFQKFSS